MPSHFLPSQLKKYWIDSQLMCIPNTLKHRHLIFHSSPFVIMSGLLHTVAEHFTPDNFKFWGSINGCDLIHCKILVFPSLLKADIDWSTLVYEMLGGLFWFRFSKLTRGSPPWLFNPWLPRYLFLSRFVSDKPRTDEGNLPEKGNARSKLWWTNFDSTFLIQIRFKCCPKTVFNIWKNSLR